MSLCVAPASRQSRHVVGGDEMHAVDDAEASRRTLVASVSARAV
jgi:hypothetical protein